MKYLDTKKDSLEEVSSKAINEKPDLTSKPRELKEDVNAKDLEEAGGKYLKYSDLLLQKGRMLATNKNTAMIDREIEKEKKKLGIQDEFDVKMQEMAVVMETEGDKEKYQKFFKPALKKFGVDSPADFKSDEEKKKFFNYVDKNYKGDHEEEVDIEESKMGALFLDMQTDAQEMSLNDFIKKHRGQMGMSPDELKRMHKEFNEEVDLEEADAHVLLDVERGDRDFENFVKKNRLKTKMSVKDVNPGYDELEITGDKRAIEKLLKLRGEDWLKFNPRRNWFEESNKLIKASVQAITDATKTDLEEKLNDNVDETLDKIREVNVSKQKSMRSILADIWNVKEGKNPFEKVKKEASSKKTLTGKKPTAVEIEPKIE